MEIAANQKKIIGLEGLKAVEIGAKEYDKEGTFFGPQNVRKSRRAEMDLPVARYCF